MSDSSLFDSIFSEIDKDIRDEYAIKDEQLFGMVSRDYYKSLNNPAVTGPKSMHKSYKKELKNNIKAKEKAERTIAIIKMTEKIRTNEANWNSTAGETEDLASGLAAALCK